MATPRAQGLFAEAQALVDAASVLGDTAVSEQAQKVQQDVVAFNASPWPSWLLTNPQAEVDALAMQIQTSSGVNPLDVDSDANLTPSAPSLSPFDQTVLDGGGYGAAGGQVAGDAAAAAAKAAAGAIGTALKWALLAVVVIVAWKMWLEKGWR